MNPPLWGRLLPVKMQLRTRSSVFTCRTPATQQRKQPGNEGASQLRHTASSKTTHHQTLPQTAPGTRNQPIKCRGLWESFSFKKLQILSGILKDFSYLQFSGSAFQQLTDSFWHQRNNLKNWLGCQVTECLFVVSEVPARSSASKKEEGKKPSSLETSKKPEAVTTPNQNTEKNQHYTHYLRILQDLCKVPHAREKILPTRQFILLLLWKQNSPPSLEFHNISNSDAKMEIPVPSFLE